MINEAQNNKKDNIATNQAVKRIISLLKKDQDLDQKEYLTLKSVKDILVINLKTNKTMIKH